MSYFGVELHGVDAAPLVRHCRAVTVFSGRRDVKALRDLRDLIGVAHPADALFGNAAKERAVRVGDGELYLAVLARLARGGDDATRHEGGELMAVADAEDGDAEVEHRGVEVRRCGVVHAVRAAREDYPAVTALCDLVRRYLVVRDDLRVNSVVSDPTRYELIVLSSEIEDQYFIHVSLLRY